MSLLPAPATRRTLTYVPMQTQTRKHTPYRTCAHSHVCLRSGFCMQPRTCMVQTSAHPHALARSLSHTYHAPATQSAPLRHWELRLELVSYKYITGLGEA